MTLIYGLWLTLFLVVSCVGEGNLSDIKQSHVQEVEEKMNKDVSHLETNKKFLIYKVLKNPEQAWFIGIIYDSNCADEENAIKKIEAAVVRSVKRWIEPLKDEIKELSKKLGDKEENNLTNDANASSEPCQKLARQELTLVDKFHIITTSSSQVMNKIQYLSMFDFVVYVHCDGQNGRFEHPERKDYGTYEGNLAVHMGISATDSGTKKIKNLKGEWFIQGTNIHEYILLHEIGHLFNMGHNEKVSVMNNKQAHEYSERDHPALRPHDKREIKERFREAFSECYE